MPLTDNVSALKWRTRKKQMPGTEMPKKHLFQEEVVGLNLYVLICRKWDTTELAFKNCIEGC